MIFVKISSGSWLHMSGQVADDHRPMALPLIEAPADGVIRGGEGLAAFALEVVSLTAAEQADVQLCPRRLWQVIRAALPEDHTAVDALEESHPCVARIVERCARMSGQKPKDFDRAAQWLDCARDFYLRAGRLPAKTVLALLGLHSSGETPAIALAAFARIRQSGLATAGLLSADEIDSFEQEIATAARLAAAVQEKRAEVEKVRIWIDDDLAALRQERRPAGSHGDAEFHDQVLGLRTMPEGTYYFLAGGLPVSKEPIYLGFGRSIYRPGTFTGTQAEYDATREPIPEPLKAAILDERCRSCRRNEIAAEDLDGDGRDPERAFAFQLLRAHVERLVKTLLTAFRGDGAVLAEKSLYGIALGYFPLVSIDDATFAIEEALRSYFDRNFVRNRTVYNDRNQQIPDDSPVAWPMGWPTLASIRGRVEHETLLSEDPPCWSLGERLRAPTPAEKRAVALQLDPLFVTTILRKVVGDKASVSTKEIWRGLLDADVIDSETPSAPVRGAISSLLESVFGFRKVDKRLDDGSRARLWIRASPDGKLPIPAPEPGDAAPPLNDGLDSMRGPLRVSLGKPGELGGWQS